MNEDPQNLAEDLLRLLQGDRRARERFGESVRPLETIAAWYRKAALHLAQLVEQLESAPPIKGYEPVLLADGRDPLEARFFAAATLYVGKKSREEAHAERRLASAIAFLADVHGRGSLVISRRAKKLELALQEPSVEVPLSKAWSRARVLESPNQLDDLVARAIGRNAEACQRLTEIARALRPGLRDPRGRVPNLESATHEAFLALRDKGAYTYDEASEDMTDASTQATRTAMDAADFDPRPAHRRNKRCRAKQQRSRVDLA